ncbi:c-type cytochrome [Sulfurospirillum barnesii]|uniref:Cytochrome c553 n=1 Tax=Sulfurospirillum barnesii (strain ATCC 700032 / DSM 10660 / SES-3) TaxID=760154 RepID=I3XZ17_SULBS|nr:c-type cytochrome [Sulfurospirillum barnesii]AFL69191.1 cytochrome c553 [Sulfurospirillum barnesii SES-3]
MKKICAVLAIAAVSSLMAADGEAIYKAKCFSCHKENAKTSALNKSQIIAGWEASKIVASLQGYKAGQGGPMKAVMKPIASGLSDDDMKAVAETIAAFK